MLKNLGIIIACERPLIWDCAGSGALSRSKYILIKLDISIGCYFTVCRAKFSAEIGRERGDTVWVSSHSHTLLRSSLPPPSRL
jgi:hypothetical protein